MRIIVVVEIHADIVARYAQLLYSIFIRQTQERKSLIISYFSIHVKGFSNTVAFLNAYAKIAICFKNIAKRARSPNII